MSRFLSLARTLSSIPVVSVSVLAASSISYASSLPKNTIADTAVVVLGPLPTDKTDSGVRGLVTFSQIRGNNSVVVIKVSLTGLKPGPHGFHIHTLGDLSKGCMSAGGHFNPIGAPHGGPNDDFENRHVGDLGNIIADENGKVDITLEDSLLSLRGEMSIIGRSVVVHADEDDLGKGMFSDSKTTGHAGARIACGVIGRAEEITILN